jgi:hypothetical protein
MEALQALVAAQAKKEAELQERYREATLAKGLAAKGQVQAAAS